MEQTFPTLNGDTANPTSVAGRHALRTLLVGVAPQWLVAGTSTGHILLGVCLLVAVLGLVEFHVWSSFRDGKEYRPRSPRRSLVRRVLPRLVGLLAAGALIAFLSTQFRTTSLLWLLFIGASLMMGAVCSTTLVWMVNAWRNPGAFDETRLPTEDLATCHSFSLIVPARHEESVLEATLCRLLQTEHPDFEVLVVVGEDDPGTKHVAERVAAAHPDRLKVVVDYSSPKNKPKALNAALPHCRGAITGVFDAEDDVHPALIRRVDQCFQRTDADVVQAGVQLTNIHSSWFAVRNALEYYFWFRSRLHFHARAGFIPLGGNTVFIRTNVLRAVDGWDEECLAEDCELGVRLSSFGAKTVVVYEPELATREETPPNLGAFVRQRTRWNQGYLQTLSRRYWRYLPLKQRALGLYTLAMPYLLALAWIMIPTAIATAIIVRAPVPITLVLFLPVLPMLVVLAVEATGLGDLCRSCRERASVRDYVRLVVGLPIYQAALAFASARAVAREARGARGWEKTAHFGLHRGEPNQNSGSEQGLPKPSPDLAQEALTAPRRLVLWQAGAPPVNGTPATPDPVGIARVGASVSDVARHGAVVSQVDVLSDGTPTNGNPTNGSPTNGSPAGPGNGRTQHFSHRARNGSPAIAALLERPAGTPLWRRVGTGPTNGSHAAQPPDEHPVDRAVLNGSAAKGARALLARFRASRAADVAGQLPLLAGVALVQFVNLPHWPEPFFDEGTYVSNAWAVQRHGALSNYTYGYGHPPLGWLAVSLWTWVTHFFGNTVYSVATGRQLMAALTVASCSLLYILARRLGIGRPFAAAAVGLFAFSPVALYFHRLVLIDNPAVTFALGAFVLATSPRRRLWTFAASGACFAAAVLSKESMLVLLPVFVYLAVQNSDRRTRRYCLTFVGSFAALVLLTYPLYALLKGELFPGHGHVSLIGEAGIQLFSRKATGSLFDPHSGTYNTVHDWLHLDPWLLGTALLLSPIALMRRTTRAVTLAFLLQCAILLRPGYLPYMYVIGLLPFAALVVAGVADSLWRCATQGLEHPEANRRRWQAVITRASRRLTPVTPRRRRSA